MVFRTFAIPYTILQTNYNKNTVYFQHEIRIVQREFHKPTERENAQGVFGFHEGGHFNASHPNELIPFDVAFGDSFLG